MRIAASTALIAGVISILMGLWANFPIALAAGVGFNAVVAFTFAAAPGMTWASAMGIVVLEGLITLVLVLTGVGRKIFRVFPPELKLAVGVGVGLFLTFIGLVDSGFVRTPASLATPVELGIDGSLSSWPILVFVIGLITAIILYLRKVPGAILIATLVATALGFVIEGIGHIGGRTPANPGGWSLNIPRFTGQVAAVPDFSLLGHFSLFGAFRSIGLIATSLFVFTLLVADFFDSIGTVVAVGETAGLLDETGEPPHLDRVLIVDSLGAVAGGAGASSATTAFVDSAAGVGDGARTGLAAVVTGVAFLLSTFLAPLLAMIPFEAATPALVFVGFLMMNQIRKINWTNLEIAIPAFLTIALMPDRKSVV
jgi:AGZA family xanthine/uracil permease-like MFS transporter